MKIFQSLLAAAGLLTVSVACGGGSGSGGSTGTGELSVEITDAALDVRHIADARITISEIRLHEEADADDGFITIWQGSREINLRALRNGVRNVLVRTEVSTGTYRQVRVVITDAYLRLTNGNEYSTADDTLHLTSQDTSGFKFFIDPAVEVQDGFSHTLLLDVDLSKSFRPMPANDPLNATRYSLHPVIRAVNLAEVGEIRGVVTADDDAGLPIGVEATVHILPPGETDPLQAVASTASEVDGSYAILGLPPGSYDVWAVNGELQAIAEDRLVTAGSVTVVDLHLQ